MYDTTQINGQFYDIVRDQIKPEVRKYNFCIKIEEKICHIVYKRIWPIRGLIDDQTRNDLKNV